MVLQAVGTAIAFLITFQMMMFVWSSAPSFKAAYADSWRKTGKVVVHLFQLQPGPDRWMAVAAFGTIGFYVALALALDITARFAH